MLDRQCMFLEKNKETYLWSSDTRKIEKPITVESREDGIDSGPTRMQGVMRSEGRRHQYSVFMKVLQVSKDQAKVLIYYNKDGKK